MNQLSAFFLKALFTRRRILLSLLACIQVTFGFSQSIGTWTFNNILTASTGTYNSASSAAFSGSIPTTAFNGGVEYYGQNGWPAGAINTAYYLEFSLSPNVGYKLDISSIVLRMRRSNTGTPAGSGPTSWSLRSSLDGFAADIASGTMTHNYANYTITPGASFLYLTSTITFRVYGYTASVGTGGTSRMVFDNITVNGIGSTLPVKLTAFTANHFSKQTVLRFQLADTETGAMYTIQRSEDAHRFQNIHSIAETETKAQKEYTYTDKLFPEVAKIYYRIQLQQPNGDLIYSPVVAVIPEQVHEEVAISSYQRQVYIKGMIPENTILRLYTNTGTLLYQTQTISIGQQWIVKVPDAIAAGIYVVELSQKTKIKTALILVK